MAPKVPAVATLAWPRAVLFDLDGTLVDTIADLASAIDATRVDFGLTPIGAAVAAGYVGHGIGPFVRDALAHGGTDVTVPGDTALTRFRAHYRAINGRQSALYPGVHDGLVRWRAVAQKLAVVTNKSREFTVPLLHHMQLAPFFDLVVCGDDVARKKPDPEPLNFACRTLGVAPTATLFIGDSSNDALAAQAAGIRVLAVPYGYHGDDDVRALPVAAVVPDIDAAVTWAATQGWPGPRLA